MVLLDLDERDVAMETWMSVIGCRPRTLALVQLERHYGGYYSRGHIDIWAKCGGVWTYIDNIGIVEATP